MALEITGNVSLGGGITIPSCYGRTFYKVYIDSNEVKIGVQYYASQTAFENNEGTITPYIQLKGGYPYDRVSDGEDILLFTQNKIKEELENLGFSVQITEL